MGDRKTDAELVHILQVLREAGSVRKAIPALGINRSTIREHVEAAKQRGLTVNTKIVDPLQKLQVENKVLVRKLKDADATSLEASDIREEIFGLAREPSDPPKWLTTKGTIDNTPGVPMTIWSDWHYGEIVKKSETDGLNEFNPAIAERRIQHLVTTTIKLIRKQVVKPFGIVVCLGGDMITGDIHPELADTSPMRPLECISNLRGLIIAALVQIADAFPGASIYVPCVVGNHGRTTMKPRMKSRVTTSYEWNLYCQLEQYFKDIGDNRFTFTVATGTDVRFCVLGHWYLLTHGDSMGVKGGDGHIGALGPIIRGFMKIIKSYAKVGQKVDTVICGHWHQLHWLFWGIVNNCLKGYDEFAKLALRADYTAASQALWFSYRGYGIAHQTQVYCDPVKPQKPLKNSAWLLVPNAK
jgi:hypothetical protein